MRKIPKHVRESMVALDATVERLIKQEEALTAAQGAKLSEGLAALISVEAQFVVLAEWLHEQGYDVTFLGSWKAV